MTDKTKQQQKISTIVVALFLLFNLATNACDVSRLDGNYFSVKDFGAVGDGVTDDTTSIQDAIDSFPGQGSPTWTPWVLYFPPGIYKVTSTIYITDQQRGAIFGYGARLLGNFGGSVIKFEDMMWFHVYGLSVEQSATNTNACGVETENNYSCTFNDMLISGGEYGFILDGNNTLLKSCVFRGSSSANVLLENASNNEVNKFVECAFELSSGYGVDGRITSMYSGTTNFDACYWEANALGNVIFSNSGRFSIIDSFFNLTNSASGVILGGTVGPLYPTKGNHLINTSSTSGGFGRVTGCKIQGGVTSKFIEELSTTSSNVAYSNNIASDSNGDLYGAAPKSINLDRRGKVPYLANKDAFLDVNADGIPDGWTGTGTVNTTTQFSPYGSGAAVAITPANMYIYQQVNVPANALIRISCYAKTSGANATAALQLWTVGLGGQLVQAATTNTTATHLEVFLTSPMRNAATSFLILLRNTGTSNQAQFCDIEIEDLTN